MDGNDRKKASVVRRYALENFSQADWITLGQLTGTSRTVEDHPRLLRSMHFGDDDYELAARDVLDQVFKNVDGSIDEVIDFFDIDLWYEQKEPAKFQRIFGRRKGSPPTFWKRDCLRVFISHLAKNRARVARLKAELEPWGITCFIAHQDIEPSREWQLEIESALTTMDVLLALIEPGFRDSQWADQEVGHALGRGIEVIPLLAGLDPHGFIGKIQGVRAKNRLPKAVAEDVADVLLRRPQHRRTMVLGMSKFLATATGSDRRRRIRQLDSTLRNEEMKSILEGSGLSDEDKEALLDVSRRVGAFEPIESDDSDSDDIPF